MSVLAEYNFKFFRNFFINDLNSTIYFENGNAREEYFDSLGNSTITFFNQRFSYVTDKQTIKVNWNYLDISSCSYGCFYNSYTGSNKMYFNIISTKYNSNGLTEVNFIIDPFTTYFVGQQNFLQRFGTQMIRQHLNQSDYDRYIDYLRHNDDVLYSSSNVYSIRQKLYSFTPGSNESYYVVFQSSADLTGGFSAYKDGDKAVLPSPKGGTFDRITSPVSLYVCGQKDFRDFMDAMRDYAHITTNFTKVITVPLAFLSATTLTPVSGLESYGISTFTNNTLSIDKDIDELSYTWAEIAEIYGIDYATERHLLRYPYCYATATTWDGQQIEIHFEDILDQGGLQFRQECCIGYHNEVVIYPKYYNSNGENNLGPIGGEGTYMNNALILSDFDDVPVLVDSYNLREAQTSYSRELAESKLISNRLDNIVNGDDLKSRLYDSVSVISNFTPYNLFNKMSDEYEYFRTQNAERNDAKITAPSISKQTHSNSFQIKQEIYGVTLKFHKVSDIVFDNVRRYHRLFGFSLPFTLSGISMNTMTKMNYVKCILNDFHIDFVDSKICDIAKLRLENGVKFWLDPTQNKDLNNNTIKN